MVTGTSRLHQTVSSLSVLEVADVNFFSQIIQTVQEEWYAEELVISSFIPLRTAWANAKRFNICMNLVKWD